MGVCGRRHWRMIGNGSSIRKNGTAFAPVHSLPHFVGMLSPASLARAGKAAGLSKADLIIVLYF